MCPSSIQQRPFNCPVAKVPAVATMATFVIFSIGEPTPLVQRDYACNHETACTERGLWQACPVRKKNIEA